MLETLETCACGELLRIQAASHGPWNEVNKSDVTLD